MWTPQITKDGSYTFFSEAFNETFHSKQGAKAEAFTKFALASDLPRLAQQASLQLLDVCYGLGYNSAAALETIWQVNPDCQVTLYGLENDATVPQAAIAPALLGDWSPPVQQALTALALGDLAALPQNLTGQLLIGDARQTIQELAAQAFQAQAIFFDPFSPRRCPQLWTVEFFQQVARCLATPGKLTTYSRSAAVRAAMQEAGLTIGSLPLAQRDPNHPHEWSQGTVASLGAADLPPLSPMEQAHLQTRAGIPLRDPSLMDSAEVILARQKQMQAESDRPSTSSWRRQWGLG
jgi:tRNA U34 5-methylaminomethyl-2-thiouridine-forming methyltransferase MnmC